MKYINRNIFHSQNFIDVISIYSYAIYILHIFFHHYFLIFLCLFYYLPMFDWYCLNSGYFVHPALFLVSMNMELCALNIKSKSFFCIIFSFSIEIRWKALGRDCFSFFDRMVIIFQNKPTSATDMHQTYRIRTLII